MFIGGTRLFYKGGTSVNCNGGTSVDYNDGMLVVCAVRFMYLFYSYMYHTHLENIQIFAILTFTKFFRFMIQ